MAETSLPWSGTTTGDAGPYSDDTWSDMYRKLFMPDRTLQGVIDNYANELEVTGATSPLSINTGAALVDGKFYENDSSGSVVVPSPAVSTRIDRIVLRKSWSAQTVRITRIEGVEGGGVPALTQNDGTTWDIPLYQASITTGGVITLTDERYFCILGIETNASDVGEALITRDVDFQDQDAHNFKQVDMQDEHDNGNSGDGAVTINWNEGNNQKITLTGNPTFSFTDPAGPCHVQLKLIQDGTGSRTVTWPSGAPGDLFWARGIAPTLSTGAAEEDIVFLWFDGTNYYGSYGLDYS